MRTVLAFEPDARQAAALTRVVRDQADADIIVVETKDAALDAIRARIPDLILLTAFSVVLGTLTWGAYAYLVLNDPNVEWSVMAYGGLGIAAAFVVMNLFKLPGWASFLVTFVGFYAPIFYVHAQYSAGELPVSIIYLYEFNQVYTWLIPVFVVIAVAVNAQALWKELRTLLGQLGLLKGSRA